MTIDTIRRYVLRRTSYPHTSPAGKRAKEENDENSYSQKLKLEQSQRVAKNGRINPASQISQISWAAPAAGASREKLGIYQVDILTRQSSKQCAQRMWRGGHQGLPSSFIAPSVPFELGMMFHERS
ncbi:hypothetical protein DAPPUDRAFT_249240 [Daphnia pulex]|uniref:Uncharacterized protein n=1 Tax=Daphnia pulex TaxID=6669 RepID=E9GW81_DAPPU|nr:hypothetical protein DAPPUDRAFT_249240 [Daphnia pulex]|eukprot:EFX76315.1 hypothetical protein DAPPUDRAFT_249240 [Daphnia pulex]